VSESGIEIAFTSDAEERVSQLASGFPDPSLLHPVTFKWSAAELEARQMAMVADRSAIQADRVSIAGLSDGNYDLNIDIPTNSLQLIAPKVTSQMKESTASRYGSDVIVVEGPIAEPATCVRADCRYDLRSGLETIDYADSSLCSSAFVVRKENGERELLSAAHCGGGGNGDLSDDRYHGGEVYGDVSDQKYEGRVDAERVSITGDFAGRAWVFRDLDHKSWDVTSVGDWSGLLLDVGGFCKAGVTTNESCGKFTSKNYSPSYVSDSNRFLLSPNMCVQPGDSGAGVYREDGHRAIGITSGAAANASGEVLNCSNEDYFSIHGHIEYVENSLNVHVVQAS
jgi:hypothetical protein